MTPVKEYLIWSCKREPDDRMRDHLVRITHKLLISKESLSMAEESFVLAYLEGALLCGSSERV